MPRRYRTSASKALPWNRVGVVLVGALLVAACGDSPSTALPTATSSASNGLDAAARETIRSAPLCDGEEPVPGEIKEELDSKLASHSGIFGVVCVGAVEDPPFMKIRVVVMHKAGVGQPVREVEDFRDYETKDGEWRDISSSLVFGWTPTDRQQEAESEAARQTFEAGAAQASATRQAGVAARETAQARFASLSFKSVEVEWYDTSQLEAGLPVLYLRFELSGVSEIDPNAPRLLAEAVIRFSNGREVPYASYGDCCSSFEKPEPGEVFLEVSVDVDTSRGAIQAPPASDLVAMVEGAQVVEARVLDVQGRIVGTWP